MPAATQSPFSVWLPRVLVVLLALHFARGVLPFAPVEGDEMGVVNGLQAWARGTGDFTAAAYSYPIQPGSYHLLRLLTRLTGAPELSVFGATTALAVAGFIGLSTALLARVSGLRPAWVAVALLLTPEITAAACYANTNALAGVFLMAGLVVARRARGHAGLWYAGLLIGLGGWLRLDSLLLSPLVLVLRLMANPVINPVRETAETAVASLLTLAPAFLLAGLPFEASLREFMGRDNFSNWHTLGVIGWLALGHVATIMSAGGILWLCLRRRWGLAALAAAATGLSLAVYGGSFVSPKYLYYAAPFLMLPALTLLAALLGVPGWRRVLGGGLLALCFAEIFLGLQTASPFRRSDPAAPILAVGPVTIAGKSVTIGLGEGELIPTMDGPRLRGGQFWAPESWRRAKTAMREEIARLDGILGGTPPEFVLTSTYLAFAITDGRLRRQGYEMGARQPFPGNPSSFAVDCRAPGRRLTLILINHTRNDTREFSAWTHPGRRTLFVNDRGGGEFVRLVANPGDWRRLSPSGNGLITLYTLQVSGQE